MPFIGIIANESDANFIKNEVLKNSKEIRFEFININKKCIENIKNVRFETVIINEDVTEFLKISKYLEDIIFNAKNIIINSDTVKNVESMIDKEKNVITFGLSQNAFVTISSVKTENILICIQKKLNNIFGEVIEEQEVNVEIEKNNRKKVCNALAVFATLAIYGEKMKKI